MANEEMNTGAAEVPVKERAADMRSVLEARNRKIEELKLRQNMPAAIIAGLIAGLACAALWAMISVVTGYQIGYMAIGVGAAVGYVVKKFGRGITPVFGIVAAVIALLSCAVGNYFSVMGYLAQEWDANFFELLTTFSAGDMMTIMAETFSFMDVVFYLIAISTAFGMGFVKEKDINL